MGKMDLRIAAIALELNCTVITRNLADFRRVPGLSIDDWSKMNDRCDQRELEKGLQKWFEPRRK